MYDLLLSITGISFPNFIRYFSISAFNAKIYFDLLSYENDHKGIYLIDQPEDNISQKAIHEYLLKRFKVMGERRQVIIVTHNPQFIVNLDVDNVVFLGKDEKGMGYEEPVPFKFHIGSCY